MHRPASWLTRQSFATLLLMPIELVIGTFEKTCASRIGEKKTESCLIFSFLALLLYKCLALIGLHEMVDQSIDLGSLKAQLIIRLAIVLINQQNKLELLFGKLT